MKWNLFATEKEIQFLGVPLYAVDVFAVSEDSALKSSCSLHCHYLITEKIRNGAVPRWELFSCVLFVSEFVGI
jgi:hypothetical protein